VSQKWYPNCEYAQQTFHVPTNVVNILANIPIRLNHSIIHFQNFKNIGWYS
jgi:hypothetical protein